MYQGGNWFTTLSPLHSKDREPPLIKGWIPYVGKALEFGRDPSTFLAALKKKHGDVFTVRIAGKYMTFVMNPALYPAVIKHGKQLDFHEFSDEVSPRTFGYPPIRSPKFSGLHEQIQRSYQFLKGENLNSLAQSVVENLELVLRQDHMTEGSQWMTDELYGFCFRVMFEASFMTLYGRPAQGSRHTQMAELAKRFRKFDAILPFLIAGVPISLLGAARSARKELKCFLQPQKLASWVAPSRFIQERVEVFEQYHLLGDLDKAGHHFTMLWAAVGNTVPASFWAVYYLLMDPEALAAVREEVHSVLEPGSEWSHALTRERMDNLLLLDSALSESLRLSAASMNIRVAQEDFTLMLAPDYSVDLRRGDIVALYPQSMHMDPEIFEEPQTYKFNRFVEDGELKRRFGKPGQKLTYSCMPFGSGSTKCPGRHLAVLEIKQFLSLLLLHFDIELLEAQKPVGLDLSRAGLGILFPAADVRFRYRRRTV
ncbi:25-hydroxycholesterol 7-alpha-hydroxylase isoform X2 [Scleropages formosus]|uniref:25-hydroxycholesterol 7-alpha-hydroxylase isoform X2 n=1 Tax=Scleropages formosus TaxID=113540 RepID=UPI0008787634|nr:25-hydroxycholesterol 7-alpha-hydroxylase isoform X2 [Scleropages formosus]